MKKKTPSNTLNAEITYEVTREPDWLAIGKTLTDFEMMINTLHETRNQQGKREVIEFYDNVIAGVKAKRDEYVKEIL